MKIGGRGALAGREGEGFSQLGPWLREVKTNGVQERGHVYFTVIRNCKRNLLHVPSPSILQVERVAVQTLCGTHVASPSSSTRRKVSGT